MTGQFGQFHSILLYESLIVQSELSAFDIICVRFIAVERILFLVVEICESNDGLVSNNSYKSLAFFGRV